MSRLQSAQTILSRAASSWRTRGLPALRLFSAKFASPEHGLDFQRPTPAHAVPSDAHMPDAPGLWTLTDEHGDPRTLRVKDQNGVLYAILGNAAVPIENLTGRWQPAQSRGPARD